MSATDNSQGPIEAWLPEEEDETQARRTSLRRSLALIAVAGFVMVGSLVWMAVAGTRDQPQSGPIVASHNSHRVEGLSHNASTGPVRFLLDVRGAPIVTEVLVDQVCVRARILQANTASPWFTKASFAGRHSAGVQMLPFQPAYLDVRIDPSTHDTGDTGAQEVLNHNIRVKTADGQVLDFVVATSGK